MKYGVFISYSHEDKFSIGPIVKLVSALRNDLVFQDTKDSKAGQLWEEKIKYALMQAKVILIFWCCHSAKSEYVRKEYEQAILDKKVIIPLLLDKTEIPDILSAYQWIDLTYANFHLEHPIIGPIRERDKHVISAMIIEKEGERETKMSKIIAEKLLEELNRKIPI